MNTVDLVHGSHRVFNPSATAQATPKPTVAHARRRAASEPSSSVFSPCHTALPPLRGGRHVPTHRDLLPFASITPEVTDV